MCRIMKFFVSTPHNYFLIMGGRDKKIYDPTPITLDIKETNFDVTLDIKETNLDYSGFYLFTL